MIIIFLDPQIVDKWKIFCFSAEAKKVIDILFSSFSGQILRKQPVNTYLYTLKEMRKRQDFHNFPSLEQSTGLLCNLQLTPDSHRQMHFISQTSPRFFYLPETLHPHSSSETWRIAETKRVTYISAKEARAWVHILCHPISTPLLPPPEKALYCQICHAISITSLFLRVPPNISLPPSFLQE